MTRSFLAVVAVICLAPTLLLSQDESPENTFSESRTGAYILGPNDVVDIAVLDADEMSGTGLRVGSDGFINLPLVGRVKLAGLSAAGAEEALREELSVYLRNPQVTVTVQEFQSQPVTIIGEISSPGVVHLQGDTTLAELISANGGVTGNAGAWVKITRRASQGPIPLESSRMAADGAFSIAEVRLRDIIDGLDPTQNIVVKPHDLVSVPKADMVYVMGSVSQTGGFLLSDRRGVSVIQAIAMAGGLQRYAAKRSSRIMRPDGTEGGYSEIPLDLKAILGGKASDIYLQKDDVLFIPKSGGKAFAQQAAEAVVRVGTGVAIIAGQ